MEVNLKCGECKTHYNFDVGEITTDNDMNLIFEHKSVCPKCGAKDKDLLSEIGQSQMTAFFFSE